MPLVDDKKERMGRPTLSLATCRVDGKLRVVIFVHLEGRDRETRVFGGDLG
jgi:hypothetical protein